MRYSLHIIISLFCIASFAQTNNFIKLEDGKFALNGQPFFAKGLNFQMTLVDNNNVLEVRPDHNQTNTNQFPCTDQATCDASILNYFLELKNNFNCNVVRFGLGAAFVSNCNDNSFTIEFKKPTIGTFTTITTTDLSFYAAHWAHVLDIAQQADIKVIMILGGIGSDCINNPTLQATYDNYLDQISQACANKPALFAYDLWNEPNYSSSYNALTKKEVCEASNHWYDLIKANDPNHLITIGFGTTGFSADIIEWSPDAIKADFFALHLYSSANREYATNGTLLVNHDYGNLQAYEERVLTTLKWWGKHVRTPWILAETSFSAISGAVNNKLDGTEAQQAAYLTYTAEKTVQAGGLGYMWWQYHDVYWGLPAAPGEDHFGLTNHNGTYKPAATAFFNFEPSQVPHTALPNYPGNYQNLMSDAGTTITGNISFSPTPQGFDNEAVVYGWHVVTNPNDPQFGKWLFGKTSLAIPNGNFSITSHTPDLINQPEQTALNILRFAALDYQTITVYNITNPTGNNVTLQAMNGNVFPPDLPINNYTIVQNSGLYYIAIRNMYLTNVNALGNNSQGVFEAGNQIEMKECSFETGSELAAYITDINAYYCNYMSAAKQMQNGPRNTTGAIAPALVINNQFITDTLLVEAVRINNEPAMACLVYPNPATEILFVKSAQSIKFIRLINAQGACNLINAMPYNDDGFSSVQLNLNDLAAGMYVLQIELENGVLMNQKIIKQ